MLGIFTSGHFKITLNYISEVKINGTVKHKSRKYFLKFV